MKITYNNFEKGSWLVNRLVFEQSPQPKFEVAAQDKKEAVEAREKGLLLDPNSLDPQKEYEAAKARLDAIAKKTGTDTKSEDYQRALKYLGEHRDNYEKTKTYAIERIKSWADLQSFAKGPVAPTFENYNLANKLSPSFQKMDKVYDSLYVRDEFFDKNRETIKNNLFSVADKFIKGELGENGRKDLESVKKAIASKENVPVATEVRNLQDIQYHLYVLINNGFEPMGANPSLLTQAQAKYDAIQQALTEYAQVNLDKAQKTGQKNEEDKGWLFNAMALKAVQDAKDNGMKARKSLAGSLDGTSIEIGKYPDYQEAVKNWDEAMKIMSRPENYKKAEELFDAASKQFNLLAANIDLEKIKRNKSGDKSPMSII